MQVARGDHTRRRRLRRDRQGFLALPAPRMARRTPAPAVGDEHAGRLCRRRRAQRLRKRVSSAVGEGSIAIQSIHEYLSPARSEAFSMLEDEQTRRSEGLLNLPERSREIAPR